MNQSREAHHPARPLHSPEGAMHSQALRTRHQGVAPPVGAEGLPQSKHGHTLNAADLRFVRPWQDSNLQPTD